MSARSFTVVYLDRRAREEGIYTQDCPPRKPAVADRNASASAYGILGSADEVDDNITTLLRTYEKGETSNTERKLFDIRLANT
jgi:hypothetical protein